MWARDATEERLLFRSLNRLALCGYPVAIADRGTRPHFTDALRAIDGVHVTVPSTAGLVPQVQASVRLAATFTSRYLLYVEPDKEEFFVRRMGAFVHQAPDADDIGIVLASRSTRALETFPAMQQRTEGLFNSFCGDVIGIEGDYAYGPFLMHRTLLPHIFSLDADLGWGWRPATFLASKREGLRVVHVTDDHFCPADQLDEDAAERAHRVRQLRENIMGLLSSDLLQGLQT